MPFSSQSPTGCPCFVSFSLPTTTRRCRTVTSQVTMRRRKPSENKPSRSSKLTSQQKERFDEIASEYGIRAQKPGSQLDKKYNEQKEEEQPTPTLYQSLASLFGVSNLEVAEKGLFVALGTLLLFVVSTGLVISSEAFFKASGKPIPDGFDNIATNIESLFTPALLTFLALSSIFGIFKQSQLNSGASAYSEKNESTK